MANGRSNKAWFRRPAPVAGAVALAILAGYAIGWSVGWYGPDSAFGFELSVEAAETELRSWGMWGAAASVLLMVIHSFVPFPAEMVAIANGMVFGPVLGVALTWSGAMLGAFLAFGLSRWLGRPFVERLLGEHHRAKLDQWTREQGGGAILVARFVPVISFNLINYAAGLTSVSWWTFTWATGLGILPLTTLMVVLGDRMIEEPRLWLWLALGAVIVWAAWRLTVAASRRKKA